MEPVVDVAIVGAGFSGTVLAANLASKRPGMSIVLIEKAAVGQFGMAYSTKSGSHLLNVPAAGMSAFVDQPGDFVSWACEKGVELTPQCFARRSLYGDYLNEILECLELTREVRVLRAEALRIRKQEADWVCELSNGASVLAKTIVLAFGNFAPATPSALMDLQGHPAFVSDPWSHLDLAALSKCSQVGIAGSGLTAVDVVLAVEEAGFRGEYTLISRHGLLPLPHKPVAVPIVRELVPGPGPSVRILVKGIRACAREAVASGSDWRAVFDVLRPNVSSYWQALDLASKRQFLRHLRSFWDVHRHRVAPEVWARIEQLIVAGRLRTVSAARMRAWADHDAIVINASSQDGHTNQEYRFDRLFNCTGSPSQIKGWPSPLVRNLVADRIAIIDSSGMGLACDDHGHLLAESGELQRGLYALGVLRRGQLWESTAVPDLRKYAASLADELARP